MRTRGVVQALWVALGLVAGAASADGRARDGASLYQEYESAAIQAYRDRDFRAMGEALQVMLRLRPGTPQVRYQWAAVQALGGQAEGALDTLSQLADQGLSFRPGAEPSFESLWTRNDFQVLAARLRDNGLPAGSAQPAFTVDAPSFIPEGLAHDPRSGASFLSSVRQRRVLRIARDGTQSEFVASGAGGLWSALGVAVDPARGWLWVASSAFPEMLGYDPLLQGRAALFAYRLADGQLAARHELPRDGVLHALGDVRVADGSVYASDSAAGQLWVLSPENGRFQPLAPRGLLVSPQGLEFSADGKTLWLADYTQGLFRYAIETQDWTRIDPPTHANLHGIDGLSRHGRDLIGIQNGIRPHRVVRLRLRDDGGIDTIEVLAQALPEFEEPTLGAVVGDRFLFVANSQWNRFDERQNLPPDSELQGPLVLELKLQP